MPGVGISLLAVLVQPIIIRKNKKVIYWNIGHAVLCTETSYGFHTLLGPLNAHPHTHFYTHILISMDLDNVYSTDRATYDWTSPAGLEKIKVAVAPHLDFPLRDFQLINSDRILNGQDVFLVATKGKGKSALIYVLAIVNRDMVVIVVEPTNFLEWSLVSRSWIHVMLAKIRVPCSGHAVDIVIDDQECAAGNMLMNLIFSSTPELLKEREHGCV